MVKMNIIGRYDKLKSCALRTSADADDYRKKPSEFMGYDYEC